MKKVFLGFLVGAITMVGATSFASNLAKKLDVYYNVNEIVVDGVRTGKGSTAFISSGTTYVPLRFVSDALNAQVYWDQNTRTITINSNGSNTSNNANGADPVDLPTAPTVQTPVTQPAPTPPVATPPAVSQTGKYIGEAKAKQIALSRVGGGQIVKFESDLYDYPAEYNIEIVNRNMVYDVDVNATSGAITKFEVESIYD